MQGATATQERVQRFRQLNENEKLSLILAQQRQLTEKDKRLTAMQCACAEGACALCADKDQAIAHLQQQVEQLRNKIFGRTSERRSRGNSKSGGGSGKNETGAKPGAPRTRLPSEQFPNAKIIETTVEDANPPVCPECSDLMTDSGMREVSERIEYQPAELYIHRISRVRCHCKRCQSAPQTAVLPARLAPGSSLGDSFLIQACVSKFFDLIPTTRFAKILARGKVNLSHTLLLRAQSYMAGFLEQVYHAIGQEVRDSEVILADETIHRQLEENGGKWRWYLWAFGNGSSIYFEIHDTRSGDVSIRFLKESGKALFLVSDAYTGYGRTIREINEARISQNLPLLQSAFCNDHARRYWYQAQPDLLAVQVLELYEKIYAIEQQVQELRSNPKYIGAENDEKALAIRQTSDPLFHKIYDISAQVLLDAPEKSLEATAARYFINHVTGLTLFLRHIQLPISNAFTERGIRSPVILRKTALGNHSQKGAREAAIQMSVMESCKLQTMDPVEYLNFNKDQYFAGKPLITPHQYRLLKKPPQPPDS